MRARTLLTTGSVAGVAVVGSLLWLAGLALVMVPTGGGPGADDGTSGTAGLPYSGRGPYPVGVRTLPAPPSTEAPSPAAAPSTEPPLTVWYPAVAPEPDRPTPRSVYPVALEVGSGPLGTVALATYEGSAAGRAEPDRSGGPYPLVVLSPGFAVNATAYGWLAEHLASYGPVVVGVDHRERLDPGRLWRATVDRPGDVTAAIDAVEREAGEGGALDGLVDATATAVIGHSYGGYTALAAAGARIRPDELDPSCRQAAAAADPVVFQCDHLLPHLDAMVELAGVSLGSDRSWPTLGDPRVDAAVALAGDAIMFGPSGLGHVTVPVLAIGGTDDRDSPFAWGTAYAYEHVSSERRVAVGLDGARHFAFAGPCERTRAALVLVPAGFCTDPGWERTDAHGVVAHFATSFLLAELTGEEAAGEVLVGRPAMAKVTVRSMGYR
ncbi:MAG: hypothetical protein R2761_29200 [Acidimicrobiales bacterium]